jgi:hypothetical protein
MLNNIVIVSVNTYGYCEGMTFVILLPRLMKEGYFKFKQKFILERNNYG